MAIDSLLMKLLIGNETILCHCVSVWQILANLVTNVENLEYIYIYIYIYVATLLPM